MGTGRGNRGTLAKPGGRAREGTAKGALALTWARAVRGKPGTPSPSPHTRSVCYKARRWAVTGAAANPGACAGCKPHFCALPSVCAVPRTLEGNKKIRHPATAGVAKTRTRGGERRAPARAATVGAGRGGWAPPAAVQWVGPHAPSCCLGGSR